MGRLDGKVAFITGAGRGQGRSHALRMAAEGADIIAVDICAPIESVPYALSGPDDLAETAREVKALGRRVHAVAADVRSEAALREAVEEGQRAVGPVDVVVANAGILVLSNDEAASAWQDVLDVNLSGVMHTVEAAAPSMVARGAGGSIVLISSVGGFLGIGGPSRGGLAYSASKHGVVGLMHSYAVNLAVHSIRVNSVHPSGVNTKMVANRAIRDYMAGEPTLANPSPHALPVAVMEPGDISDAVLFLASDESRYITGVALPVDAGFMVKK